MDQGLVTLDTLDGRAAGCWYCHIMHSHLLTYLLIVSCLIVKKHVCDWRVVGVGVGVGVGAFLVRRHGVWGYVSMYHKYYVVLGAPILSKRPFILF
jgi:hypothetical protein